MGKTNGADGSNGRPENAITTAGVGAGTPAPGGRIGPYQLLEVLGEGGFATVYLAQQHEPVRRLVALKIVKPGMDSQTLLARFEAERQALALLDHPHIARVFDAGTTETGRPYFVMEYVKGLPITEHCDRHKLPIEERLLLFLQVCEAVQHAHQKGIIHRDIKPSNVLVFLEGDRAGPKVIDFGIAKALGQPLTQRTLHTELGQLIGTPEYMSPEQAEMSAQDIDTRSDVYSLGVVLYELLAGVLPFASETLRSAGPEQVKKVIREQEPRTPSLRLGELTRQETDRVAQGRRAEAGVLGRRLRGDLDWITLKAMDKDRTRRYASVGELMADIRRHLHDEPVLAGPPSTAYRLKKFVRRNQALVTGLAAVLVVLAAGIVASTWSALQAERQGRTAQAVADFLTRDLLGLVDPNQAKGQDVSVRYILDGASAHLQGKFEDEPRVEAAIRQTLADTYLKLGEWRLARPHIERVVELRRRRLGQEDPATLAALGQLAQIYAVEARQEDAERLSAEVLQIKRRRLGDKDPSTLASMLQLGSLYMTQGRFAQAEALLNEALELSRRHLGEGHVQTLGCMCGLAGLHSFQGRTDEARALLLRALEIQERSGGGQEELMSSLLIAVAFQDLGKGRPEEAQALLARALALCRRTFGAEHQATLKALSALGMLHQLQGRYDQGVEVLAPALDTSRRVLGAAHPLTTDLMERLGTAYLGLGRYAEAEPLLLQHQQATAQRLGQNHPSTVASLRRLVGFYEAWGKTEEAERWKAQLPPETPAR